MRRFGFVASVVSVGLCGVSLAQDKDLEIISVESEFGFVEPEDVSLDGSLVAVTMYDADSDEESVGFYASGAGTRALPDGLLGIEIEAIAIVPMESAALVQGYDDDYNDTFRLISGDLHAFVRTGDASLLDVVEVELPRGLDSFDLEERYFSDGTIGASWEVNNDDGEYEFRRGAVRIGTDGSVEIVREMLEPDYGYMTSVLDGYVGSIIAGTMSATELESVGADPAVMDAGASEVAAWWDTRGKLHALMPLADRKGGIYDATHASVDPDGRVVVSGIYNWQEFEPKPWPAYEPKMEDGFDDMDEEDIASEQEWENTIDRTDLVRWVDGKPEALIPTPAEIGSPEDTALQYRVLWTSEDGTMMTCVWRLAMSPRAEDEMIREYEEKGVSPDSFEGRVGAFVWTEDEGFETCASYLARHGYDVPDEGLAIVAMRSADRSAAVGLWVEGFAMSAKRSVFVARVGDGMTSGGK